MLLLICNNQLLEWKDRKITRYQSPRRLRAKYTPRTNLRFMLSVFRPCREQSHASVTYTNAVAFGYAGYGNKPIAIPLILSVHLSFQLSEEGEESTLTTRHSFIQMTKLSNVRGRITYISSHAKQEHLYAVYETTERSYWTELARCSQQEFKKSGVEGKCTKKIGRNNPKVEQIEQDNKLRMDWNREVDRAIISDVPMDDILQIKREHITEPIKRSIQRYGNKPQRLTLILNMAITELVLLISKVLEAARTIWSKIQHTDVVIADKTDNVSHIVADTATHIEENAIIEDIKPKQGESAENVITSPSKEMVATQKTPAKPVMTPVVADYTKLKKIKEELDNQNKLIFEAEQRRGNFEIELSDLKGLAKLTRKAELQRKIDEKTDYIDRLKIGLSNMVRNYGFENMNEFYLSYKESKTAFADYQQKIEDWKKGYDNVVVSKDKTETMSEKLDRLQNEVESSRQYNKQNQAKWAR